MPRLLPRLLTLALLAALAPAAHAQLPPLAHTITGHVHATARAPLGWTETIEGTVTFRRVGEDDFAYTYALERAELTWRASGPVGEEGCTASGEAQLVETAAESAQMMVFRGSWLYSAWGAASNPTGAEELHVDCPEPFEDFDAVRATGTYLAVPAGGFEYVEVGITEFYWLFAGDHGTGTWDDPEFAWRLESDPLVTPADDGPDALVAALSAPAPHPVRGAARLTLDVPTGGTVTAAVYDATGRQVGVLHDGPAAAGPLALTLDAHRLAPGAYVVRARGDGFAVSRTVTVVR